MHVPKAARSHPLMSYNNLCINYIIMIVAYSNVLHEEGRFSKDQNTRLE